MAEWPGSPGNPHGAAHNREDARVTRRDVGKLGFAAGFAGLFAGPAWAQAAAETAVAAAQQYRGLTINIVWEAGL